MLLPGEGGDGDRPAEPGSPGSRCPCPTSSTIDALLVSARLIAAAGDGRLHVDAVAGVRPAPGVRADGQRRACRWRRR